MALPLSNSAEGGTSGTAYSAANTGGASGDAFDAVTTGGTGTFSNAQAAHGSLSYLHSTGATAAAYYGEWNATSLVSATTLYGRIYIYLTANPAATVNVVNWRVSSATASGRISISTAGRIFLTDAAGSAVIQSTVALTLNAWNRIEWSCTPNASSTTGAAELRHYAGDSTTLAETAQTVSANNFGSAAITVCRFGIPTSTANVATFYMDDYGLSATGFLGPATSSAAATASGAFTFSGTATGQAAASSSGALSFTGTATASAPATANGTLSFGGSATASAPATAAGSFSFTGTAAAATTASASASGGFTLTGTASASAGTAGVPPITITATSIGAVTVSGASAGAVSASSSSASAVTVTSSSGPLVTVH